MYFALNGPGVHEINKVRYRTNEIFRRREGEPIVADFDMLATRARIEAGCQLRDAYVPMSHLQSEADVEEWLKDFGMKINEVWVPGTGFEKSYPKILLFYLPNKKGIVPPLMPRVYLCEGEKEIIAHRPIAARELAGYLHF